MKTLTVGKKYTINFDRFKEEFVPTINKYRKEVYITQFYMFKKNKPIECITFDESYSHFAVRFSGQTRYSYFPKDSLGIFLEARPYKQSEMEL